MAKEAKDTRDDDSKATSNLVFDKDVLKRSPNEIAPDTTQQDYLDALYERVQERKRAAGEID